MKYAKAYVGSAVAGLSVLYTSLDDGGVSAQEWVGVVIATLTTFGGVAATRNKE